MVNARAVARLGMLAVGLGIGVAVASTPGVARADDFQISIDGMDLFSQAGNTATAYSGSGDIAIAYGDGAVATAEGGTGDYALADGSEANAFAGGISSDTGADDDTAIDIGSNTGSFGTTPFDEGAFAGNSDLKGATDGGTGSGDTAINIGNISSDGGGSFAGAGGLVGATGDGNGDSAIYVGNNAFGDGAEAFEGNDNDAAVFGDNAGALAGGGNNNVADVIGPGSSAIAGDGNDDVGYVFDPFGTDGSTAYAGFPGGDSDLSAVFGDDLLSDSTQGQIDMYDIMTPSGDFPGSVGPLLAELLSLF